MADGQTGHLQTQGFLLQEKVARMSSYHGNVLLDSPIISKEIFFRISNEVTMETSY